MTIKKAMEGAVLAIEEARTYYRMETPIGFDIRFLAARDNLVRALKDLDELFLSLRLIEDVVVKAGDKIQEIPVAKSVRGV